MAFCSVCKRLLMPYPENLDRKPGTGVGFQDRITSVSGWKRGCMSHKKVSVYTKPGCSLCEKAVLLIHKVRSGIPFHLEVIDITYSQRLMEDHGLHVPVVFIDGAEVFRSRVNEGKFRALLASREE